MSSICAGCKKPLANGEKPVVLSVVIRQKTYPARFSTPRFEGDSANLIDRGGSGFETVSETRGHAVCPLPVRRRKPKAKAKTAAPAKVVA